MEDTEESVPVFAVTAAVGAVVLLLIIVCGVGKKDNQKDAKEDEPEEVKNGNLNKNQQSKKTKLTRTRKELSKPNFSHPWLAGTLKAHSGLVLDLDFSPNGKYVATCAEDRAVLLWNVKEFTQKEHKSIRANVELDHATRVRFSPDSKAFIVKLASENTIRVYKIGKKADGSPGNFQAVIDFPKLHTADIINIGIASSGKFIMTCSADTTLRIWDLKGEVLAVIDSHQVNNSYGAVSPCGRFVGSSGFTSDVKVWEVCFDKSGGFKEVQRAFELKGHQAGVYSFAFSSDSHRMASVSKDGTWKLWNTNVEYQMRQDPFLLVTGQCNHIGYSLIALSPDARAVVIATGSRILAYSGLTGEEEEKFEDVHSGTTTAVSFDISGNFFLISGGKHVTIFHNVTGHKAAIVDLTEKKKTASNSAMKERIQQQINEARKALDGILGATT